MQILEPIAEDQFLLTRFVGLMQRNSTFLRQELHVCTWNPECDQSPRFWLTRTDTNTSLMFCRGKASSNLYFLSVVNATRSLLWFRSLIVVRRGSPPKNNNKFVCLFQGYDGENWCTCNLELLSPRCAIKNNINMDFKRRAVLSLTDPTLVHHRNSNTDLMLEFESDCLFA